MSLRFKINTIEETSSTNLLMKDWKNDGLLSHGDVIRALNQTAGIGRSGNSWESEKNKNLTFSLYLEPDFIEASEVFLLNKLVSLSIHDYLIDKQLDTVKIKWPNDVYVGDRKIAGMLTHNSFLGAKLEYSIVGLGLNINQTEFKSNAPNPISLKQLTGHTFDLENELQSVLTCIVKRYSRLELKKQQSLDAEYLSCLYGLNEKRSYVDCEGKFKGSIKGIDSFGRLLVEKENNQIFTYDIKEIEFV